MDMSWVDKYEELESDYDTFYRESVTSITLYILYVDHTNTLQKIKKDNILLDDNSLLKKEYIISLIKKYEIDHNQEIKGEKKYKLTSFLKYNITLESDDISKFMEKSIENVDNYLYPQPTIEDIKYDDSISIFHDLNSLYFIFTEIPKKLKKNNTKKIYIRNQNKKTKRNKLKDT